MNKELDTEKFNKSVEYIRNSVSMKDVLDKYNLMNEYTQQGENILIKCPFHVDNTPSMSVNLNRGLYRCFSCGDSGGVVKLQVHLENLRGGKITLPSFVENRLKSDVIMQLHLGISSVYNEDTKELVLPRKVAVNKDLVEGPQTVLALSRMIKRDKRLNSLDTIKKVISLVEEGVRPSDIYDIIQRQSKIVFETSTPKVKFDVQNFLKGGDWNG